MKRLFLVFSVILIGVQYTFAQVAGGQQRNYRSIAGNDEFNYLNPRDFIIGGVTITGTQFLDNDVLLTISKLHVGDRIEIPSEATSNVVKNLMSQGLFDDVKLEADVIRNDTIYLNIAVVERPRLTRIDLTGMSKSQTEEVRKRLNENTGRIINQNLLNTTENTIRRFLREKGFLYPDIKISQRKDSNEVNNEILDVTVERNKKVRAKQINFTGNEDFSDRQMRRYLKKVKQKEWWRIWGPGKFNYEKLETGKEALLSKLNNKGYRDMAILRDTVIQLDRKNVQVDIEVYEGPKYYFGNITWSGNAKYKSEDLTRILGIEKGQVFSEEFLSKRLHGGGKIGRDVSSLYMDDGYLTFQVEPVETRMYQDTIDLELRMFEGPQYTVSKVTVRGNDVTNDKVLMRQLRTKPGQKFSKTAVMQTIREIATLGNFDESKTEIDPRPNPSDGTVDLDYTVAEKPSDQIELSGGFGAGQIIGTLGLTFNNFSTKNIFNRKAWQPLPKGDGQKLSIRGQTSGSRYQSYSFSFSEPWLGGKKPIYFGLSAFTSMSSYVGYDYTTGRYQDVTDVTPRIRMNGVTITLGRRLRWPDYNFQLNYSLNLQQYKLQNWTGFLFPTGTAYNINLTQEISRNSLDDPIFPQSGSHLRFTVQATPPYSLLNSLNYGTATDQDRYRWTEYHKWKFDSQWFQTVIGKLTFKAQAQFGFIGSYSDQTGTSAFERFKLGGDGMQGFDFLQGSEIIAMRGYANGVVIPESASTTNDINIARNSGSPIYTRYQMELRYPVMNSEQARVFLLAFADAGNTWNRFKDFNPFQVRRSVGIGARIFLPIFGLLGIDYGNAFDPVPGLSRDQWRQPFTFSIMQQMGGFN